MNQCLALHVVLSHYGHHFTVTWWFSVVMFPYMFGLLFPSRAFL